MLKELTKKLFGSRVVDQANRQQFKAIASKDGNAIEEVISLVYTEISSRWSKPRPVLDGGAHYGLHTLQLAKLPKVEKVIGVEANSKTYEAFKASPKFKSAVGNIDLIHAALQGDPDPSEIAFTASSTHPGRSGIKPVMALYDKATLFDSPAPVPATTIDALFAARNLDCGFIKLDLEGSEFSALQGGRQTLMSSHPVCVFENGPDTPEYIGYTREDFLRFLDSTGSVAMTVFGDAMTAENQRDFWYGWALPKEGFAEYRSILVKSLNAYCEKRLAPSAAI